MGPSEAARRVDTSPDTIKRWLKDYSEHFSPGAVPEGTRTRNLDRRDVAILLLIKNLRAAGLLHEDIRGRLDELRAAGYADLPPVPGDSGESMTAEVAAARASTMVEKALLERELDQAQQQLKMARMELTAARSELAEAHETGQSQAGRIHELELMLERARGQVAQLEARLSGYALGGERAISPALLMLFMLVAGAVLMLIAFAALRLAG